MPGAQVVLWRWYCQHVHQTSKPTGYTQIIQLPGGKSIDLNLYAVGKQQIQPGD